MIRDFISFNFPIYFYYILCSYCIFFHIIIGIVYSKLALSQKFPKPYFAWIPILNLYVIIKLGKTNPWLLLSLIGLIFPKLWIFFLAAFLCIIANFIGDILRKFGVGSLLIYAGIIVPFIGVIPLIEIYHKAKYNILENIVLEY